jgi:hypothetical protein
LEDKVRPSIERLKVMKRLIDNAIAKGLPLDTIITLIEE